MPLIEPVEVMGEQAGEHAAEPEPGRLDRPPWRKGIPHG
jgi:hypothetical protein